jgi:hypothetical protein
MAERPRYRQPARRTTRPTTEFSTTPTSAPRELRGPLRGSLLRYVSTAALRSGPYREKASRDLDRPFVAERRLMENGRSDGGLGLRGGLSNRRLYPPPRVFSRFAITHEINDDLLAPRFASSQRAYVASGPQVLVEPVVRASVHRDAEDR